MMLQGRADLGNRRSIIALGLTVWSAMTALSGLAGSFLQLALARVGVGIGEASASPAAYSMLADYYPTRLRSTVLGIYSSDACSWRLALGNELSSNIKVRNVSQPTPGNAHEPTGGSATHS